MLRIRRILHPTDFSPASQNAFDLALALAHRFEAELHLLHALVLNADDPHDPAHHFPDLETLAARLQQVVQEDMDRLVTLEEARDVPVVTAKVRGVAAREVICDYARDHDVDLVVMGTHGRRGAGRWLLGSVAEGVVYGSPAPVVTVPGSLDMRRPRRILIPVDFSDHAALAVVYAREIAATHEATLLVAHVLEEYDFPPFYTSSGVTGLPRDLEKLKERTEEALEELLEKCGGPRVPHELRVVTGRAAAVSLTDLAEREACDLIVIASHGLSGIGRGLLGSVAERVVRLARCAVLTVKVGGKSLLEGE